MNAEYPPSRVMPGILARLASEDWGGMTRRANASTNHVKSLDRWVAKAREANPSLSDEPRMARHCASLMLAAGIPARVLG